MDHKKKKNFKNLYMSFEQISTKIQIALQVKDLIITLNIND